MLFMPVWEPRHLKMSLSASNTFKQVKSLMDELCTRCLNKILKDMQRVALGAVSASFAQQMNQTQSYEARFGFNGTKYKSILH